MSNNDRNTSCLKMFSAKCTYYSAVSINLYVFSFNNALNWNIIASISQNIEEMSSLQCAITIHTTDVHILICSPQLIKPSESIYSFFFYSLGLLPRHFEWKFMLNVKTYCYNSEMVYIFQRIIYFFL